MKTIQFVILGGKNSEKRILSIKKKNGGEYIQYYLKDINTHVTPSCEYKDDEDIDIDKEKIELLQSSIDFTIVED